MHIACSTTHFLWGPIVYSMKWFKKIIIISFIVGLTACQTLNGFNRTQLNVLQSQGFVLTDEGWALGLPEKLLFAVNESSIQPATYLKLVELSQRLNKVGINKLKVNGYTDNTGSVTYNNELSLNRAQGVTKALIDGGIPSSHVVPRGLGSQHPLAENTTIEGRAENRRVTIIVTP